MWSKRYRLHACQDCERNDRPHKALGLCRPCYQKAKAYPWQRRYRQIHPEKQPIYALKWKQANPAAVRRSKRVWNLKNADKTRTYLKNWRRRQKAPFCLICGEDRVCDWAHLIPHGNGGPVVPWNLIPLCPTHHRCFDAGLLTVDEHLVIAPYLQQARERLATSQAQEPGASEGLSLGLTL